MTREISARLTEQVNELAPYFTNKLRPALKLANHQLEYLCPAMMATSRKGLIAELVAHVPRYTWLIVLANPRKLFTLRIYIPPEAPFTRRQYLDDCVAGAVEAYGHVPTANDIVHGIDLIIEQHGGRPEAKTPQLSQDACANIVGFLFAPIPHPGRGEIIEIVDKMIAENVCPLHVGLIGRGTRPNTKCGVWPIGLPFALYVEHIGQLASE
ncbi:MAG TPA: hypothetical protein VM910_23285 [Bradyrhizobium sp.]|jgi:hypothetical protein|nr:hypothetical protein [Bradyrhizobium sp.]